MPPAMQNQASPAKPSAPEAELISGWPIRISIASVVVAAMLVLALVIIGLGWQGVRQSMLDTATKTARDAGQLIAEKSLDRKSVV